MRLRLWRNKNLAPSDAPAAKWWRLVSAVAVMVIVWLCLLPYIARLPIVRTFIARNEALGIDPSAKFYSELPELPYISLGDGAATRGSK